VVLPKDIHARFLSAPLIHITKTQSSVRNALPFLTTCDARGRLHAFV
jgi:hypothetical protein